MFWSYPPTVLFRKRSTTDWRCSAGRVHILPNGSSQQLMGSHCGPSTNTPSNDMSHLWTTQFTDFDISVLPLQLRSPTTTSTPESELRSSSTCSSRASYSVQKMRASINRPPTPDAEEDGDQQPTLHEIIQIKLIESGEKERLKELLKERLIECGWSDEMRALCRAFAKKKGRNNVTVDDLVQVITPKGRASVPDSVKAELLQRIRSFLASAAL